MSIDRSEAPQRRRSLLSAIVAHIPPEQFGRYILVGAGNTLFGYATFALFTALLNPVVPHSYIPAIVLSSLLNISVAFLGYKWFVFKTKGNYLREWVRCVAVYGSGILWGVLLLPLVVLVIRHTTSLVTQAPYVGGAVLTLFGVLYNFFGHKRFSFRSREANDPS